MIDVAALPLVGLTAWQALFDNGNFIAGQRVLINGAGGVVGGYAVQLAKEAGAQVIGTAGPRSAVRAREAGADQIIDRTLVDVIAAMTESLDPLVNLAPVAPRQLAALLALIRNGGTLVNTTGRLSAPSDDARGVRGIELFVRNDSDQLADLAARVGTGELRLDGSRRVAPADLPALHAQAAAGELTGKVVVCPQPA